jgi:hypothetical protein
LSKDLVLVLIIEVNVRVHYIENPCAWKLNGERKKFKHPFISSNIPRLNQNIVAYRSSARIFSITLSGTRVIKNN